MKATLFTLFAVVVCSVAAFTEQQYQDAFTNWMRLHSKSYHHDEFQHRFRVFKDNMDYVDQANRKETGMTLAINKFADLSNKEFNKLYLGTRVGEQDIVANSGSQPTPEYVNALPTSWDWNAKGAVTPIKNQEQCGSCWSFSTTGSTEGCHFISGKKLVGLSEQDLMDCSIPYGNEGCDGGLMTLAMEYIIDNKGIDTEASYPYTAEDGTSCKFKKSSIGATLTGMVNVTSGDESDLQAKAYVGPVSVAIDAGVSSFQFYSTGVYYEPECGSTFGSLDHGVLVTGWGVETNATVSTPYWIVKNSWGTDWGQEGWIWMSRNKDNNCGIATAATLPTC